MKNGLITFPKHHVVPNQYFESELNTMNGVSLTKKSININKTNDVYVSCLGKAEEVLTNTDPTKVDGNSSLSDNFLTSNYASTLEKPVVFDPGTRLKTVVELLNHNYTLACSLFHNLLR